MGADMLLRDLYLPAGTGIDLAAAKAAASSLCRAATVTELRVLLDHDRISHPALYAYEVSDSQITPHVEVLRATAEQELHRLLDAFAASLQDRDVARFRFDRADNEAGVDAYVTGGYLNGHSPTDSYDAWAIIYDTDRFPASWCDRIGAAAGLLHPTGTGATTLTVTFHRWSHTRPAVQEIEA